MSLDSLDFEGITENDLIELLEAKVPEGIRLDYKRLLYGGSDADKRELLKDVSAFANTLGGHLIIGIDESKGVPIKIDGLSGIDPDETTLKIDQIIRSGIEPRIHGLHVRAIHLSNDAYCIAIRIPRSFNQPHRIIAQNSNRFWIRNSGGAHEASMDELRSLFRFGSDAIERSKAFRDVRVSEISDKNQSRALAAGGKLIIHIIPIASSSSSINVNIEQAHQNNKSFRPIGSTGYTPRYNLEGFINERPGPANNGYTQIFRNGALEATKAPIITERGGKRFIPAFKFEKDIFEVTPEYINKLGAIGAAPPFVVVFTLLEMKGVSYKVSTNSFDDPEPLLDRDIVFLPPCLINDYGSDADYHKAIKPAFDALWNASGRPFAESFSSDGQWQKRN